MKKKQLEMILERLEGFSRPSFQREQYATPATVAAEMLFLAAMHEDLGTVCDLGCGTGILAIGAALLGARAVGVEIDGDTEAYAFDLNEFFKVERGHFVHEEAVDKWIKEYGVRYFSELTNMACLTEEVGELARVIARTYGDQSFKKGEKPNLGEEMADVLWVLICLANQTGIDLTEELQKSIDKKTQRDAERHKNNPKLKDHNDSKLKE